MERKTKLQILEETFNYYNEDVSRRAIKYTGGCEYLTPDGRMCAFGRCEISPKNSRENINSACAVNERFRNEDKMNQALKEEYRGHSEDFWVDVQNFHDDHFYWGPVGVNERGLKRYNNLVLQYS